MVNKKGQVWVETVIYTLIAFALIGVALSLVKPQIGKMQDKAIIEQSITVLQSIDNTIFEIIQKGSGNKRKLELGLKQGSLIIDAGNETLTFDMDSQATFSEPGSIIQEGNLFIKTIENGETNQVTLQLNYSGKYNLTYQGIEQIKSMTASDRPYDLFLTNKGDNVIDIEIL